MTHRTSTPQECKAIRASAKRFLSTLDPADQPHLHAAARYLANGWAAIPCCDGQCDGKRLHRTKHEHWSAGKAPYVGWSQFLTRLPTVEELKRWWKKYPKANVGVVLGPASGLIGVDVDDQAGEDKLKDLFPAGLPSTLGFTTQSGGRRLLYSWSADNPYPKGRHEHTHGRALTFQCGLFTVMPSSVGRTGNPYVWGDGSAQDLRVIVATPADLADYLLTPRQKSRQLSVVPREGETPADRRRLMARGKGFCLSHWPAVSGRKGNNKTFTLACILVHGLALTVDESFGLMLDHYNPRCEPPWEEKDLRYKLESAKKDGWWEPIPERPRQASASREGKQPASPPAADNASIANHQEENMDTNKEQEHSTNTTTKYRSNSLNEYKQGRNGTIVYPSGGLELGGSTDWPPPGPAAQTQAGPAQTDSCLPQNRIPATAWPSPAKADQAGGEKPKLRVLGSDITERPVDWLVARMIPRRLITYVVGAPGTGKSTFGACVAKQAGRTLIMPGIEEEADGQVMPRLRVNGVAGDSVGFLTRGDWTLPGKQDDLIGELLDFKADLLWIDPLDDYMGNADENDAKAVRGILKALMTVAREANCGVAFVRHPGKNPANLFPGSRVWFTMPRWVLELVKDFGEDKRRVIRQAKESLGPVLPPHYFTLEGEERQPKVFTLGEPLTPDRAELVGTVMDKEEGRRMREAKAFLLTYYADGEQPVAPMWVVVDKLKMGTRTVRYAAEELGMLSRSTGSGPGSVTYWRLPDQPEKHW